jgi:mannose-1-phosphate guanylyltransferase/phosphomannomutase
MLRFERDAAAQRVAGLVGASGAHLGGVLDPAGDRLTLIDDEGHVLTDTESTLAMLELVGDHLLGDTVALPVNVTTHAERLAQAHGIHVRPTKLTAQALADAATEPGVGMAADGQGGFILPGFLPAFDAAAAFVKVLDLLARTGKRLSTLVAALPRVHVAHETVVTPWDQKGLVMRSLVEVANRDLLLVDGVKLFHDEGWALALPDPEEPVTHVWAEAGTDSDARRLAQEYVRRIRQMVR